MAYSAVHGQISFELRKIGVPVLDTLEDIHDPPDIIHGHHHLDTTYALLCFPDTPCVNFCHGIVPWEELPAAALEAIRLYVAVSVATKSHLLSYGVPPSSIRVLPNFVDSTRFAPFVNDHRLAVDASDEPTRPIKALAYGNYRCKYHNIIEEACKKEGIVLDSIGRPWGNSILNPEDILADYDIVFCYGKSAIESLYSGCHVILCHIDGVGPSVNESNFNELRLRNFGFHTCQEIPELRALQQKLHMIRNERECGAKPITEDQRDSLGSDYFIDCLIDIYKEALIDFNQSRTGRNPGSHDRVALARYVQFLQKSRLSQKINFYPPDTKEAWRLKTTIKDADERLRLLRTEKESLLKTNKHLESHLSLALEDSAAARLCLADLKTRSDELSDFNDLLASLSDKTQRSTLNLLSRYTALFSSLANAPEKPGKSPKV